jgi:hypothetical protein
MSTMNYDSATFKSFTKAYEAVASLVRGENKKTPIDLRPFPSKLTRSPIKLFMIPRM